MRESRAQGVRRASLTAVSNPPSATRYQALQAHYRLWPRFENRTDSDSIRLASEQGENGPHSAPCDMGRASWVMTT